METNPETDKERSVRGEHGGLANGRSYERKEPGGDAEDDLRAGEVGFYTFG